jgi:hypothetical protein
MSHLWSNLARVTLRHVLSKLVDLLIDIRNHRSAALARCVIPIPSREHTILIGVRRSMSYLEGTCSQCRLLLRSSKIGQCKDYWLANVLLLLFGIDTGEL